LPVLFRIKANRQAWEWGAGSYGGPWLFTCLGLLPSSVVASMLRLLGSLFVPCR
jgi:hypothetical protein